MFAGRYLWWNLIASMAYVFFAIYFYYVSWLTIRVSGCAAVAGSCGLLETQLNAVVRPYGMITCGIIVVAVGVMRIRFLRMSPLWALALFVWFGASSQFFFTFGNLWFARTPLADIIAGMPIEAYFLAALVAFLCFPVELYKKSPEGGLRVMYFVAGFTASYSFSFTIASSPKVLAYVRLLTGSEEMVADTARLQAKMQHFLALGQPGTLPIAVALGIFSAALGYLLGARKQPGGVAVAAAA